MDRDLRRLQRTTHAHDAAGLLRLLSARRRAAAAGRPPKSGHLVAGPLLAAALQAALDATGQREVDLLRAQGLPEPHLERWINRLRRLLRGEPVAWLWVERWAALLTAFGLTELASAAERQPHPVRP